MIEFSDFGNRATNETDPGPRQGISGKDPTANPERQQYLKNS